MSETIWNTKELRVVIDEEVELQGGWTSAFITVPVDELTAFAEHWLERRKRREPELLPCPACGSEALLVTHYAFYAFCLNKDCRLTGPIYDHDGAKWNALPRKEER